MPSSMASLILSCSLISLTFAHPKHHPDVFHINETPEKVLSAVQFTYPGTGFDGPKVRPVNTTTFDWWYFDAVSSDLASGDLSSVVVTFYDATAGGFEALSETDTKLEVSISGSFKDGAPFGIDAFPAEAVVVTTGESSQGIWGKYGSWKASPNLKWWDIHFQDKKKGVKGSMTLESVAPAHLPCGAPDKGATEMLMPEIGWANAVPDAKAKVHFDIGGQKLQFSGVGYHDKNWGAVPFFSVVANWYWGHGHLGPYSIVWFDARSITNTEYFSAYVAKDGRLLSSSCSKKSVTARPWGGEDTYPPPHSNKSPKGFEVAFADVGGKEMRVNITNADIVIPYKNVYDRYIGTLEGGFVGEDEMWTGVAQYEQFKF